MCDKKYSSYWPHSSRRKSRCYCRLLSSALRESTVPPDHGLIGLTVFIRDTCDHWPCTDPFGKDRQGKQAKSSISSSEQHDCDHRVLRCVIYSKRRGKERKKNVRWINVYSIFKNIFLRINNNLKSVKLNDLYNNGYVIFFIWRLYIGIYLFLSEDN